MAEDELVVVRVTMTGIHTGINQISVAHPASERQSLRAAEILIFPIAGGKTVESRATWDPLSVLEPWCTVSGVGCRGFRQ